MNNGVCNSEQDYFKAELDTGRVHPWVGLGRFGSGWVTKFSFLGGSGPVSKMFNKYAIYRQKPINR